MGGVADVLQITSVNCAKEQTPGRGEKTSRAQRIVGVAART